ncbi:hypothetical protein QZH41_000607 [Actinostola sp. cb2023]|nr:hypothetical protein QZH41_000607 [Actinostola sp. cb2023]
MELFSGTGLNAWFLKIYFVVVLCITSETQAAQKKGFRGGEKSYGIKVEANPIGTNLFYKLPEAKAKSSSPMDWKVDNDNAQMMVALNSPIAAFVYTTNPKFNVKGEWPGYKTKLKLPKDDTLAGSGTFVSGNDEDFSGSGSAEPQEQIDEDSSASGSSSDVDEEDSRQNYGEDVEEFKLPKRRSKVIHRTKPHQHDDQGKVKKEQDDEFLKKVKYAVEKLKHFDLNDPKTSRALKDIITHAKRVVIEAKTVLRDVVSVVRSVQYFVTGKYNSEEDDESTMTLPDEDTALEKTATNAREDAKHAARQADFAAKRAQAASKMAEEIANNFWKVAQKSRALAKLRDVVSPYTNPTIKKLVKIHENSHQRNKLLNTKENAAKNSKHFKNDTSEVKKHEHNGKDLPSKIDEKPSKNATETETNFIADNKTTETTRERLENEKAIKMDDTKKSIN